jgi:penicillin-binding protein 2
VNVVEAIARSCIVFFYRLGAQLDIDLIASYAKRMGLGRVTGIDLPHEAAGLVPTRAWKHRARGESWYDGETISVSIGQGQTMTTPLQLARLVALVANGGHLVQPHIVRTVADLPAAYQPPVHTGLTPETLQVITEGLIAAVNGNGTGYRARLPQITVAGKTGSAQVVARSRRGGDDREEFRAHGWFLSFAPAESPEIALAVIVEHGESGGSSAAPLARQVLARYFAARLGARAGIAGD